MGRTGMVKDTLQYFILPEDTTEAGGGADLLSRASLAGRRSWLGPLKTVLWTAVAVAAPLLLAAALA